MQGAQSFQDVKGIQESSIYITVVKWRECFPVHRNYLFCDPAQEFVVHYQGVCKFCRNNVNELAKEHMRYTWQGHYNKIAWICCAPCRLKIIALCKQWKLVFMLIGELFPRDLVPIVRSYFVFGESPRNPTSRLELIGKKLEAFAWSPGCKQVTACVMYTFVSFVSMYFIQHLDDFAIRSLRAANINSWAIDVMVRMSYVFMFFRKFIEAVLGGSAHGLRTRFLCWFMGACAALCTYI